MRYIGEVNVRFKGDRELASQYLPEARKYLGVVLNIMALGGVDTSKRELRNQDGIIFRVGRFGAGNLPFIEIDTSAVTQGSIDDDDLFGFVLCPGVVPDGFGDSVHHSQVEYVVLQPTPGDTATSWLPYFYDATVAPATGKFGIQTADTQGRALFLDGTLNADANPHRNGLQFYGNIDWRNTDESLICTWFGPLSRYFGNFDSTNIVSPFVFFHGQILFDCQVLTDAGFFVDDAALTFGSDYGGPGGVATGACISTDPTLGTVLLVAVRFGKLNVPVGSGQPRREYLLRLRLSTIDARGESGSKAAIWQLAPPVLPATLPGSPEILWSQSIPESIGDMAHPWFFNQATTEARCIRAYGVPGFPREMRECVLKPVLGTWTYSEINHPAANLTTTTSRDDFDSVSTTRVIPVFDAASPPDGTCGPLVQTIAGAIFPAVVSFYEYPVTGGGGAPAACFTGVGTASHSSEVQTADQAWVIAAVDYRDNVPVYAYGKPPSYTIEASSTFAYSGSYGTSGSISGAWGSNFVFDSENTSTHSGSKSSTSATTGITGGLQTDWIELVTTHTASLTQSASNTATDDQIGRQTWVWDEVLCKYDDAVVGEAISRTMTWDVSGSEASSDRVETLYVTYLDLRYKLISYGIGAVTHTVALSYSDAPSSSGVVPTATIPIDLVTNDTTDYYVKIDAVALAHTTAVINTPTSSSIAFDYSAHNGVWENLPGYPVGFPTPVPDAGGCTPDPSPPADVITTVDTIAQPLIGMNPRSSLWAIAFDDVGPITYVAHVNRSYGSWQTYKGLYCFSQAMPSGDHVTANFVFKASNSPDLKAFTNTAGNASIVRMHPIWTLPRVTD